MIPSPINKVVSASASDEARGTSYHLGEHGEYEARAK